MILQFEISSKLFGILQFLKFLIKKEKEGKECHMQNSIRPYNILLGEKNRKNLWKMNRSHNVFIAEKMIKCCVQDTIRSYNVVLHKGIKNRETKRKERKESSEQDSIFDTTESILRSVKDSVEEGG